MNRLREKWQEFLTIPFPKAPQDDYLGELFAELVLIDTHIAGIVTSFLDKVKVDKKLIYVDHDYNDKLNNYIPADPKSQNIMEIMRERKYKLDQLTEIVLSLYDYY